MVQRQQPQAAQDGEETHLHRAGDGLLALVVLATAATLEPGVVSLSGTCNLSDVGVDQRRDRLNTIVENADRRHRLAELLRELPDRIKMLKKVVAHPGFVATRQESWVVVGLLLHQYWYSNGTKLPPRTTTLNSSRGIHG